MKLLSIDIENFLSIESAHVDFDDNGLLLIEGWNYDVDRANGAGKTAILNAISFALYDKLPRKVTASEILRRGSKSGSVTLKLSNSSETLIVRRSRPKGVSFTKELDDGTLEELKLTQTEWEAKLRLTYNQFIVSMYCSQGNTSSRFLLLNDADKKTFLLQLLNLNEFALCKKLVDDKITTILLTAQQTQNRLNELQVKIDAYSESLIDEESARLAIAQKEDTKKKFMKALHEHQSVIKPDLAKYQKLEGDIQTKKMEFVKLKAEDEYLRKEYSSLNRKILQDKCPTCGSIVGNKEELQNERQAIKQKLDNIALSLQKESQVDDLFQKLKSKKYTESANYDKSQIAQAEINARINMLSAEISDQNDKLLNNSKLVERINKFTEQKCILKEQVDALAKDLEIQKTVAAIYSPTGAQAYILDSAVALFNEQIKKYIEILWHNLTYELQSYKETAKGEVTAKFSESIVMDGRPISLGSLSGGELKALSICTDMALLGILEQQFGIHMSPVIFDEAFDGLDASGKEFALELIRELAKDRQVIVIDHASEMRTAFDKTLRVEKRNGISTVSVNT